MSEEQSRPGPDDQRPPHAKPADLGPADLGATDLGTTDAVGGAADTSPVLTGPAQPAATPPAPTEPSRFYRVVRWLWSANPVTMSVLSISASTSKQSAMTCKASRQITRSYSTASKASR